MGFQKDENIIMNVKIPERMRKAAASSLPRDDEFNEEEEGKERAHPTA
jgi:hypothetical protein